MKLFAKIGKKELLAVILISVAIVFASLFQLFLFIINAPEGTVCPLIHNYPADYYYYLSYIKQGMEGKMLVTSRFSPEIFPSQFIFTFYPLIGFLGNIIRLPVHFIYLSARIVLGATLLVLGYILGAYIFPGKKIRILSYVLIVLSAPFWYVGLGITRVYGGFWTGLDPFLKVAYLPHHLFADCMLILSVIFLYKGIIRQRLDRTILGGILGAFGGWSNTAVLFAFIPILFSIFLLDLQNLRKNFLHLLIFGILLAIPAFFLNMITHTVFPWTVFNLWERGNVYPLDDKPLGVLQLLGISGVFALFSLPISIKKGNVLVKAIAGWFLAPFLGLMLFQKILPISNIRYLQAAFYIPGAILSAYFFSEIMGFVGKRNKVMKALITFVFVLICGVSVAPSFYAFYLEETQSVPQNRYSPLVYPSRDFMDVLSWLDRNGKADEVVLSDTVSGPLIPAFTNKRVVYGHPVLTYNAPEKVRDTNSFYGFASLALSKEILNKHNVVYFLDWPQNSLVKEEFLSLVGAKRAYSNGGYIIYQIGR